MSVKIVTGFSFFAVLTIACALFLVPIYTATAKPRYRAASKSTLVSAHKTFVKPLKKAAKPLPRPAPELPGIVVRVTSLRYTVERVRLGDKSYLPKAGQKSLVIGLSIDNADYTALSTDSSILKVWANSSPITRTARVDGITLVAGTGAKVATARTAVFLDSVGEVDSIMVKLADISFIFDVKGKIARLPKDYVDTNDPRGYIPASQIMMRFGVWYPTGDFSIRFDRYGYTTDAIGGKFPPEDTRYRVFNFTLRNDAGIPLEITPETISATTKAEADPYFRWNRVVLQVDKDEPQMGIIQPNGEAGFRLFGIQPRGMAFDGFVFQHGEDARRFLAIADSTK